MRCLRKFNIHHGVFEQLAENELNVHRNIGEGCIQVPVQLQPTFAQGRGNVVFGGCPLSLVWYCCCSCRAHIRDVAIMAGEGNQRLITRVKLTLNFQYPLTYIE